MGSKPWLYPAPTYRTIETFWVTDEDAPGPRCGHTLTAVAATKTQGPRLILFGGATAIEGGSSSAPGIRNSSFTHSLCLPLFFFSLPEFRCFYFAGLAGVTNTVHSYDVQSRKWTRWVWFSFSQLLNLPNSVNFSVCLCLCVLVCFHFYYFRFDWWIGTEAMIFATVTIQYQTRWRVSISSSCSCCCCNWYHGCFAGDFLN